MCEFGCDCYQHQLQATCGGCGEAITEENPAVEIITIPLEDIFPFKTGLKEAAERYEKFGFGKDYAKRMDVNQESKGLDYFYDKAEVYGSKLRPNPKNTGKYNTIYHVSNQSLAVYKYGYLIFEDK